MRLEGLTRGFDLGSEDSLARAVANASLLPPGAISISLVGGTAARRLAETTGAVTLDVAMSSDDAGVGAAAIGLSSLGSNSPFLLEVANALGEDSISVGVVGNLSAVDGSSEELAAQFIITTSLSTSSADVDASTSSTSSTAAGETSTSMTGANISTRLGCVCKLVCFGHMLLWMDRCQSYGLKAGR